MTPYKNITEINIKNEKSAAIFSNVCLKTRIVNMRLCFFDIKLHIS